MPVTEKVNQMVIFLASLLYNGAVTYKWCCHILPDKGNGRRTDKKMRKMLIQWWKSFRGGEIGRGSRKERIRTGQVTDKERSTNVHVTDV